MTRKSFNRLRGLGVLSVVAILALGVTLLYFATGSAWLHRPQLIATPAEPNTVQPVLPTVTPAPTTTSVWSAVVLMRAPTPTPTPESSVVTMTTTLVNTYVEQEGDPRIRFVHASPDAPPLDIYVDGIKAFEQQVFQSVTPYLRVPTGTHAIRATASDGKVLFEATMTAQWQRDTSIVAVNPVAVIQPLILNDDNTLPRYGEVRVRVAHMAVRQTVISVRWLSGGKTLSLAQKLAFRSDSRYTEMPVKLATMQYQKEDEAPMVMQIDPSKLTMGTVYTLWVFDGNGNAKFALSEDAFKYYALLPVTGAY